jgi:hypothetical protein
MEENAKKAEKSGNSLTQMLDDNGELVGVANMNTQEKALTRQDANGGISVADIRSELFEGDNVITGKTDNGRSELVSGPFATR